jgi:hypothetical protein
VFPDDLLIAKRPPANRIGSCVGGIEQHLTEGAVMLAYALHLLRTTKAQRVTIHPDGEHGKRFAFRPWLERQGHDFVSALGTTSYGGLYCNAEDREIEVNPKSGLGDVTAIVGNRRIVAEAKGGIINTRHAGQTSRLRKGLCEAVSLLLASPAEDNLQQVAVVPRTDATMRLAERMSARCRRAGIEIALVDGAGQITEIR